MSREKMASVTSQTQADEERRNPLVDVHLRGETVWITPRIDIVRIPVLQVSRLPAVKVEGFPVPG